MPPIELKAQRLRTVLPKEEYDVVVVGDSPTLTEIYAQEPFQASAAVLFKKVIKMVHHNLNEVLDKPIKDLRIFYTYATDMYTEKEPTASQISSYKPMLESVLRRAKPKVIIALGNAAGKSLAITKAGVMEGRGKWKWDGRLNAYTILTFHPKYVATSPNTFQTWLLDLDKALRLIQREKGLQNEVPQTKVYVLPTVEKTKAFLQFLRKDKRIVASDIETRGFDFKKDKLLCQGFTYKEGESYVIPEEIILDESIHDDLKATIESKNITWLYHNGKFDNKFFRAQYGIRARTDIDTMLYHYCLDVRKGTHDLEQVAIEFCNFEPWEHHAHKYVKESFADIPRPILYKYQGVDTDATFRIYHAMKPFFDEEVKRGRKIQKELDLLMDASEYYMHMEINGHHTNREHIERLKEEYGPRLEKLFEDLVEKANLSGWDPVEYARWADKAKYDEWLKKGKAAGKKQPGPTKVPKTFNPNSYMHIRFLLFHVWQLKPIIKKKKISSDADSLNIYKERLTDVNAIQFIDAKLSYAKDKKMYSTYILGIDKIIDKDTDRAHTTFKLHGTETGRLSSADPNFHNIPRQSDIKNIFDAEDGFVLMQHDYSQAELRVLSVEGGDPWLQGVYYKGSDLHDEISIQLFGPNFTKEQRVRAKAVNFGIPYGRSAYTLAAEHNMSIKEAEQLIEDWYAPQPLTRRWMEERRQDPLEGRVFETPVGRIRPFGLVTDTNKNGLQNEAVNFPIQSEASDCMVWSVCRIEEEIEVLNEMYGETVARLVNTVHDSVIAEVKKDPEIIRLVYIIHQTYMPVAASVLLDTEVPFLADAEIGPSWGELYEMKVADNGDILYEDKSGNLNSVMDTDW